MNLLEAIGHSVNTIFAQLVVALGAKNVVTTAHRMGIRSPLKAVCSITSARRRRLAPCEIWRGFMAPAVARLPGRSFQRLARLIAFSLIGNHFRMARQSDSWLAEQLGKPYRLVGLIGAAAILSAGALFGLAASVGLQEVWQKLVFPHWYWLPIAVAGLLVAYLGYTIAYREVVRAERGPELDVPSVAALVATGFGVFIQGGGFALDRAALERAGMSERQARERVLGLGTLEYAVLAPATVIASALLLAENGGSIDTSMTLSWLIGVPVGAVLALSALR